MPGLEHEGTARPIDHLYRKIESLSIFQNEREFDEDLILTAHLRLILAKLNGVLNDSQDRTEIARHTFLADQICHGLGISLRESVARQGLGPPLTIPDSEFTRWQRASLQSEHRYSLGLVSGSLPGLPGYVSFRLNCREGSVSLDTTLGPSEVDHRPIESLIRSVGLGTLGSPQFKEDLFEELGSLLPNKDDEDSKRVGREYYYSHQSEEARTLSETLSNTAYMKMRLGCIPMADPSSFGHIKMEAIHVAQAFKHFHHTSASHMPCYEVRSYSGTEEIGYIIYTITSTDGKHQYNLSLQENHDPNNVYSSERYISLSKIEGRVSSRASPGEFRDSIETDLEVARHVINWLYRYSETYSSADEISIRLQDEVLADRLINTGIIQRLTVDNLHRDWDDIGGHQSIKQYLQSLADSVILHIREDFERPGHAILVGESGIGKTAMSAAFLRQIAEKDIPIYMINSSSEAGRIFAENPGILFNLALLASVNQGVIYIPDLDTITSGLNPQQKIDVETQLNRLFETTTNVTKIWVIADTARPEVIRDSIIGPHRLGCHVIKVPIETDPVGTYEIIERIFYEIGQRFGFKRTDIYTFLASGEVDLGSIASYVAQSGIITPGRLAAVVEGILISNENFTTEAFMTAIKQAEEWEREIRERRREYQKHRWVEDALDALEERMAIRFEELHRELEVHTGTDDKLDKRMRSLRTYVNESFERLIRQIETSLRPLRMRNEELATELDELRNSLPQPDSQEKE